MITCSEAGYLKGLLMQNQHVSEVARLKWQIELECESGKRALHGFTPVASHAAATASMERMWDDVEKLERIAGKEACKAFLKRL
ncbi:MAG TPA: hypothetical protein VHV10_15660 [Ktedonobacteraceae bacterium]|jgi:hypothetical protein|nr:hypothetical protein [Ktedonobacteraceae bacterium]